MSGYRDCTCQSCSITFRASRSDAKYCSTRCRQRSRRKPQNFRSRLIARALKASTYLIGQVAPSYNIGTREPVFGPMVSRAAALAELNAFLALPEPFADAELVAVLKAEGILDHMAPVPEASKGVYAKRARLG